MIQIRSLKRLLSKITLQFEEHAEEQEYVATKRPFLKEFFLYLLSGITVILIVYAIRYFDLNISPQNYLIVGLAVFGFVVFCVQRKLDKYMEYILLAYYLVIVALFTTIFLGLVGRNNSEVSSEQFYMGYAFAMVHRLLGYQILKFKSMALITILSIALKFPLIPVEGSGLTIIIVILDLLTLFLCFKSEGMERGLFDSLYKSKKDILKFKHLLTTYLPNQMVIFANDYSQVQYMNNCFKRTFKCHNTPQVKESLNRYIIEKETLEKHKSFFAKIGFLNQGETPCFSLSHFMWCLGQNLNVLKENAMISFPVLENETPPVEDQKEAPNDQNPHTEGRELLSKRQHRDPSESLKSSKQSSEGTKKDLLILPDANESYKSSERGSSKSHSSDFVLDEGVKRVYKVKIFPLLWDDKEAIAMVFDDITQQKIIMELKVADQNKDLVIAMVSHELRTPLNGMLGLLDIARKHIEKSDALSYLNACKNSGILMLNLVNSILDMNQIKNKKLRLVYTKIYIKDILNEIKGLFDYYCMLKNLFLEIEIDPRVPKAIITDKNRLSQILVNLLGNAFKFTFNGGITVKVTLEEYNPIKVRFSVQDTGIGIKRQDQDRLFKMYGRLEQEDNKVNTQGIGLGLTISNTLAMLLNPIDQKSIQMESEVNKGTCFSFVVQSHSGEGDSAQLSLADISSNILNEDRDATVLKKMTFYANPENEVSKSVSQNVGPKPLFPSFSWQKPKSENNSKPSGLVTNSNLEESSSKLFRSDLPDKAINQLKTLVFPEIPEENPLEPEKPWCLVVDDNPFNLMVACHIMEERNYQVKTGLNGQESIQRVKEHQARGLKFSVILMDCQMPVMDGYEATKILREMMKNGECDSCPIIALTANNRDELHDKRCEDAGMSGHVSKPLQIDELESVLRQVHNVK